MFKTAEPIGIIGGSGFYSLLNDSETLNIATPYGKTSDDITKGTINDRTVYFLSRHGSKHQYPAHRVPYQANLWALKSLGINQIISLTAVGSLDAQLTPGTFVVSDQIVDRTRTRISTFCNEDKGAIHVSLADPYCEKGRSALVESCKSLEFKFCDKSIMVVIDGPRFSSRAESQEFQRNGWSIIGMTGMPEAALARELSMCYSTLSLVTDFDAGVNSGEGVTQKEVLELFSANLPKMKDIVMRAIDFLPEKQRNCECVTVFEGTPKPYWMP